MSETQTTIPAARVREGDRLTNVSGTVQRISRVPGGFIFHMPFCDVVRNHDESVTIRG